MASCQVHGQQSFLNEGPGIDTLDLEHRRASGVPLLGCHPDVHRTCWCVSFIAENTRIKENSNKVGTSAAADLHPAVPSTSVLCILHYALLILR